MTWVQQLWMEDYENFWKIDSWQMVTIIVAWKIDLSLHFPIGSEQMALLISVDFQSSSNNYCTMADCFKSVEVVSLELFVQDCWIEATVNYNLQQKYGPRKNPFPLNAGSQCLLGQRVGGRGTKIHSSQHSNVFRLLHFYCTLKMLMLFLSTRHG